MTNNLWVFDTNTLVSALFDENSKPGLALKKARETGKLIVSPEIIAEYLEVFSRPKFDKYISPEIRLLFIDNIISEAELKRPTEEINICRDPKDNKFLELALSSNTRCIVSGDKDLLVLHPFKNIPIISAADFLESKIA